MANLDDFKELELNSIENNLHYDKIEMKQKRKDNNKKHNRFLCSVKSEALKEFPGNRSKVTNQIFKFMQNNSDMINSLCAAYGVVEDKEEFYLNKTKELMLSNEAKEFFKRK